jgi:ubiquinone/menaquinone biosynthesis C-methylase UbiE
MDNKVDKFSAKSENYAKYRPDYPVEILQIFKDYNFCNKSIVADIGSGTGKLTKLFLENGNIVYAVEPNDDMRNMADALLGDYKNYISINGSAENTKLPVETMDFVIVGTAFHWFDAPKAIAEFKRILKKNGVLALIWNDPKMDTPFLIEYDKFIKNIPEYNESPHLRNIPGGTIKSYFYKDYHEIILKNSQEFNFSELIGRFSSSSYVPKEGTQEYNTSSKYLETIFNQYNEDNKVVFNYNTKIYIGRI